MLGAINQALYLSITNALRRNTQAASDSLIRLSTGNRLVRPSDDIAAFSVVSNLNTQLRGLTQAAKNVNIAQGVVNSADTALSNMEDLAYQIRDLALQAADDTLTAAERSNLNLEAQELLRDFASIPLQSGFNGRTLFDGQYSASLLTGPNADSVMSFSIGDARASSLGKLAIYSGAQGSSAAIGVGASTLLTLNGVSIGASTDDGVSIVNSSGSSLALANAINARAGDTGVSAEALATEVTIYIDDFAGAYTGTFSLGDLYINDTAILGSVASVGELVSVINDASDESGVRAEVDSSGNVTLIADDGRNIALTVSNSSLNAVYDIFNITTNNASGIFAANVSSTLSSTGSDDYVTGAIQLYSSKSIIIGGGATVSASLGIASGYKNLVDGTSAVNITIGTEDDALQSLKILDSVIADISTLRAEIGGVHSRLDSRAALLLESQITLDDAKTAIGGTDFALEIAKLTSAQILQNAGLAALTQANISQNTVQGLLSLLG